MVNKDATEIFKNSTRLADIVNDHILKIMMGPNYKEHEHFEQKLEELKNGEMDESYCYLYVPKDVQEYGASAAANINNSPHNFENSKNKGMTFSHLKIKEIRNYMYEIYAE